MQMFQNELLLKIVRLESEKFIQNVFKLCKDGKRKVHVILSPVASE